MKMVMFLVVIFLLIGSLMILGARDISLSNSTGRKTFFLSFLEWMGVVGKSSYDTAGYAIKQDWLPNVSQNSSNSSIRKLLR